MLDPKFFENIAKELSSKIPSNIQSLRTELEDHFKNTLENIFSKLKLVSRDEFEVQVLLLEKARERIAVLEEKIKEYEKKA